MTTNGLENPSVRQRTLAAHFHIWGKGVHTNKPVSMTVHPAQPDVGICFLRADQPPSQRLILARWSNVVRSEYSTDIGNAAGITVRSVEHLMAALRMGGVDNALVELDGPEVPAMDGSAVLFLRRIDAAGTVEQDAPARTIILLRPVEIREGSRLVRLTPSLLPRLFVTIDYPGTPLGIQSLGVVWQRDLLRREVALARAFGFAADHEGLMERGHALGADLGNTVVVDGELIRNPGGLRYRDECVRHKMLDAIGDLSLAGFAIWADYEGYKPGHSLNARLLRAVFERDSGAWVFAPTQTRGASPMAPGANRVQPAKGGVMCGL